GAHGAPHSARRALVVNAAELLREPGLTKRITTSLALAELEIPADGGSANGVNEEVGRGLHGPVGIDVELTSTLDGIVAEATLSARLDTECSGCLVPLDVPLCITTVDTFAEDDAGGEHFPIEHRQLDLAPMVRDALLLAIPDAPRCRADCAGLCPVCGLDRNKSSCDCVVAVVDDRWAALDELRGGDTASSPEPT
ncbi:MAG: DUF177 domain-containing protein, partial [Actinomycetota bacterium]|nr:DUF177 domain-containing protein [Actinomycetota bacterium]